jgi:hypothetical protein
MALFACCAWSGTRQKKNSLPVYSNSFDFEKDIALIETVPFVSDQNKFAKKFAISCSFAEIK